MRIKDILKRIWFEERGESGWYNPALLASQSKEWAANKAKDEAAKKIYLYGIAPKQNSPSGPPRGYTGYLPVATPSTSTANQYFSPTGGSGSKTYENISHSPYNYVPQPVASGGGGGTPAPGGGTPPPQVSGFPTYTIPDINLNIPNYAWDPQLHYAVLLQTVLHLQAVFPFHQM